MIETYLSAVLRRLKSKRGQTLVEYALVLALISVVAITTLSAMGVQVKGVFTTITSQLALSKNGGSSGSGGSGGGPPSHGGGG